MMATELSLDQQMIVRSLDVVALCSASPIDCKPYHLLRPTLRAIGMVTSPATNAAFYTEAVGQVQTDEHAVVAVSGAADHFWALPESPIRPLVALGAEVSIYDICPTPLALSLGAAAAQGIELAVVTKDVRRDIGDKQRDIIVSDAFLTQFQNPSDRIAVLTGWRKGLGPRGIVATTIHLRKGGRSGDRLASFVEAAKSCYASSGLEDALRIDVNRFGDMASEYAFSMKGRTYQSMSEVKDEVNAAGLVIEDARDFGVAYPTGATLHYIGLILRNA